MTFCAHCRQHYADTPTNEAANDNIGFINVKNIRELLRPENISRIAIEYSKIQVSSREAINWMTDVLFIEFEGIMLWPNGKPFEIGDEDLDRVFYNPTATRWLRSLRANAGKPVLQFGPLALAERYRFLDIALQAHVITRTRK